MRLERRTTLRAFAVAASAAIATALAPATAHAFCRTRTVAAPVDFVPTSNPTRCFDDGLPLYHSSQCLPFHLLEPGSARVSRAALSEALGRAFTAWTARNADCSPGITAIELAPVSNEKIADYMMGERGHNVFGIVEGPWPHAGGGDTLALATLTFNADTGEIYDADLELRSDVEYAVGDELKPNAFDFDAVIFHEAGHIFGLAHTDAPDSVMSPSLTPGDVRRRELSGDDGQGICAIYPNRQTRATGGALIASTSCDLSASTPTPSAPCGDPDITHGCSVGTPSTPSTPGLFAALGALAFLVLIYARRIFASASSASSEI